MGIELVCAVLVNDVCIRTFTMSRTGGEIGRWMWVWNHFRLENSWHTDVMSVNVRNFHIQSFKILHPLTRPSVFILHIAHETTIGHNSPIHSFTGERQKLAISVIDQNLSILCCYKNIRRSINFCGYNTLAEGVFVTKLSSNMVISAWQIVWVMTNCCLMTVIFFHPSPYLFQNMTQNMNSLFHISQISFSCK
jgi:hypothetical protein